MGTPSSRAKIESVSSGNRIIASLIAGMRYRAPLRIDFSFINVDSVFVSNYSSAQEWRTAFELSEGQKDAVRQALGAWSSVANIRFREVPDNRKRAGLLRFGGDTGQSTATGYLPSATAAAGDVWISSALDRSEIEPGSWGYYLLLHEIGHALGLKHPGSYGAGDKAPFLRGAEDSLQYTVMSYNDHPHGIFQDVSYQPGGRYSWVNEYVYPSTPMPYDILAMQHLYGANKDYRKGDTVYRFEPGKPFLTTLRDTGGSDSINVSRFSEGVRIDLRPGRFSSLTILPDLPAGKSMDPRANYDGTDNLAIARDTWVEDAIGGRGRDRLIGNKRANRLTGNAGRDRLEGGKGADQLVGGRDADRLTGGRGADRFEYKTPAEGRDTITDFSVTEKDRVTIRGARFGGLKVGRLRGGSFVSNPAGLAGKPDHRLVFSTRDHRLYYDANGSAPGGRSLLAYFSNRAVLASANILVV